MADQNLTSLGTVLLFPLRTVLNLWGRHVCGLSCCQRCGDSWLWKEGHVTSYDSTWVDGVDGHVTRGCFPLCEECWSSLTTEERIPFYQQLADIWVEQGETRERADSIVAAARREGLEAVRRG